jgi:hypothetical protein
MLYFESFDAGAHWAYFRLETAPLDPIGEPPDGKIGDYEVPGNEYLSEHRGEYAIGWQDADRDSDEDAEALDVRDEGPRREVVRYHRPGAFLIVQKMAPYNLNRETYDGRHNKMSSDEFRRYIEKVIEVSNRAGA